MNRKTTPLLRTTLVVLAILAELDCPQRNKMRSTRSQTCRMAPLRQLTNASSNSQAS